MTEDIGFGVITIQTDWRLRVYPVPEMQTQGEHPLGAIGAG